MKNVDEALKNMDDLIALSHKKIETLEEMKTALRIRKVWADAFDKGAKVRVIDHNAMHPSESKRPPTEEGRKKLYGRIKHSPRTVGMLTDGTNEKSLNKLEFAYIKGYVDQLDEDEHQPPG